MERLVKKYAEKLQSAGLCDAPLVCGFDDEVVWNRSDPLVPILTDVMARMNINSLICGEPAEPYRTILKYLVKKNPHTIVPRDCETRTFLHDLPVSRSFSAEKILGALLRRKSVVTMEGGTVRLVTFGTVSPEQPSVPLSPVCFAAFVLVFSDYLAHKRKGRTTGEEDAA
ncbi:MAG: rRNA adenine dimethylase, partial [Thermodesulfobacteriota bacterium]